MIKPLDQLKERCVTIPLSMKYSFVSDFEVARSELTSNSSKMMRALIKYFIENKKDIKFIKRLKEIVSNDS